MGVDGEPLVRRRLAEREVGGEAADLWRELEAVARAGADHDDVADAVEQEVLDLLDEPLSR